MHELRIPCAQSQPLSIAPGRIGDILRMHRHRVKQEEGHSAKPDHLPFLTPSAHHQRGTVPLGSFNQSPGCQSKATGRRRSCAAIGGRLAHRSRVGWWGRTGSLCRDSQSPLALDRARLQLLDVNLEPRAQSTYLKWNG